MHPALLVDELLRPILDYCCDDADGAYDHRATLYRIARTCRAWHEPALDLLWCRLPSIVPLMALVPSLYCREGRFTLERSMTASECARFASYANRVKYIVQNSGFPLDPDVSDHVPFFLPGTNILLLPNLLEIRTASAGFLDPSCCRPLSPQLQELSVRMDAARSGPDAGDALCDYLALAAHVAPALGRVVVRGPISPRLNRTLAALSGLRACVFRSGRSLAPATLAALARFPALTALTVRADHIDIDDLLPPPGFDLGLAPGPLFPALEQLTIHAHEPLITHILEHLTPGRLHALDLEIEGSLGTAPRWDALLALVQAHAPSLRALAIEYNAPYTEHLDAPDAAPAPPPHALTLDTLAPLQHAYGLTRLSLALLRPLALSDADVARLGTWWPRLEALALGMPLALLEGDHGCCCRVPATPAALAHAARAWPALSHLTLPLDTSSGALARASAALAVEGAPKQHALRSLCVPSGAPPEPADAWAVYFRALFPELEYVDGSGHSENVAEWEAVERAMRLL